MAVNKDLARAVAIGLAILLVVIVVMSVRANASDTDAATPDAPRPLSHTGHVL